MTWLWDEVEDGEWDDAELVLGIAELVAGGCDALNGLRR